MATKEEKEKYKTQLINIGKRICYYRTQKGWSKQELSDRSGVDRTIVFSIESAEGANTTIITICKIAEVLGIKLSNLIV